MLTYKGGNRVSKGTYWNLRKGLRVDVMEEDILPGDAASTFLRMPVAVMLLSGPFIGLLYAIQQTVSILLYLPVGRLATFTGRSIGVMYQFYRLFKGTERIRVLARQIHVHFGVLWRLVSVSLTGILQFAIAHTSWIGLVRIIAMFSSALATSCGGSRLEN